LNVTRPYRLDVTHVVAMFKAPLFNIGKRLNATVGVGRKTTNKIAAVIGANLVDHKKRVEWGAVKRGNTFNVYTIAILSGMGLTDNLHMKSSKEPLD
jgi:hypothetical protein